MPFAIGAPCSNRVLDLENVAYFAGEWLLDFGLALLPVTVIEISNLVRQRGVEPPAADDPQLAS